MATIISSVVTFNGTNHTWHVTLKRYIHFMQTNKLPKRLINIVTQRNVGDIPGTSIILSII